MSGTMIQPMIQPTKVYINAWESPERIHMASETPTTLTRIDTHACAHTHTETQTTGLL
jgi:hypothetical protein